MARLLLERGVNFTYEAEKIVYTIPETPHTYLPDFKLDNGIFVEAKGNFDREARKKMALVCEQNPDLDIRLLFMRDNRIGKHKKYSDWCKQRGIKYHVSLNGTIPEEWTMEGEKNDNGNE